MKAIFKREFKSYYTSITGYAFAAFLLLFAGIYTMSVSLVAGYASFEFVIGNMAFIFLLIVPILTMKVFAEERKQKTDILLYSLPMPMYKIVCGKYLALVAVFAVPMAIISVYPLLLSMYGDMVFKVIYGSIFGFMLLGAALISVGMFVSSLTESQPMAAGITFLLILINYLSASLATYLPAGGQLVANLCLFERLNYFIYGAIYLSDVVFYLSVIGIFMFLTVQTLEKRRWS